MYSLQGGSWVQTQELTAPDGAPQDRFGFSVAVSGSTLVAGATFHEAAYVYSLAGGSWSLSQELVSGSTIVVGARYHNAAYVFALQGGS